MLSLESGFRNFLDSATIFGSLMDAGTWLSSVFVYLGILISDFVELFAHFRLMWIPFLC